MRHQSRDRAAEHASSPSRSRRRRPDLRVAARTSRGCSWTDKEGGVILSSMHRRAGLLLLLGASAAGVAAQSLAPARAGRQRPGVRHRACCRRRPSSPIAVDIAQWNALRQSDNLPFSSYATFLPRHRGWPGETAMRRSAERRLSLEAASPGEVIRFFSRTSAADPGRPCPARLRAAGDRPRATRRARRRGAPGPAACCRRPTSSACSARSAAPSRPTITTRRMEVLLGNGDTQSAARSLAWAPAGQARRSSRRGSRCRPARADAAEPARRARSARRARDPGLIIDRANLAAQHRPERRGARCCSPAGRASTGRRPMPRAGSTPR